MIKQITQLLLLLITSIGISQSNFNLIRTDSDKIKFKLIDNLIVLPIEINGVELSFLLDSGVSKPILFNIANFTDSLQINNVETMYLHGLGADGAVEALRSKGNVVEIGKAINVNQDIYVIFDADINFAPRLGVPIHGIIGYDVFKDFIVEINYGNRFIKLHKPSTFEYKKCKKCETFELTTHKNKPYIDGSVEIGAQHIPIKLLIDTGGSDALWLFEDADKGIKTFENKYFNDYLGRGLSGSVYGKRSNVASFSLKGFKLEEVNVAFPDSASISIARQFKERNGSIAGELLKRFNIIIDYTNGKITLKKNANFKLPFQYNKSGIVLEQGGARLVKEMDHGLRSDIVNTENSNAKIVYRTTYNYSWKPAYIIAELRENSPAAKAGLKIGDIVLSVNNKESHVLGLQEINGIFRDEDGKKVKLKVERNGVILVYHFILEPLF